MAGTIRGLRFLRSVFVDAFDRIAVRRSIRTSTLIEAGHGFKHSRGPVLSMHTRTLKIPNQLGVIELGTNSLKFHFQSPGDRQVETARVEWEIGFEIFLAKSISVPIQTRILSYVRKLIEDFDLLQAHRQKHEEGNSAHLPLTGIATGAFAHADNAEELFQLLYEEFNIKIQLLDSREEASLLVEGFRPIVQEYPAMLCDFGAGRLEVVYLCSSDHFLHEGFDIGAIKLQQLETLEGEDWDEAKMKKFLQAHLAGARVLPIDKAYATGGTVRAVAQMACSQDLTLAQIQLLSERTRRLGPPSGLSPFRRQHFYPALQLLEEFFKHFKISTLHYRSVGGGDVFMKNLL